jgi:AraC-like DNA-binding protein
MGPGQSYVERLPVVGLADLVRTVWVQRMGAEPYEQRNLPTGGIELHCPVGSVPRVVGPLTGPSVEVLAPGTTLVGVRFRPGVAGAVFGRPASDLVDLTLGLDEVWGTAAARDLGERLADAGSPEAALQVVQADLLTRRAGAWPPPDPLVAEAVRRLMPWRAAAVGSIAALGDRLGTSDSQLRRRCQAAVGVGPKALQRTLRFQGFLALAQSGGMRPPSPDDGGLAALAARSGYADHAHLTRECRRLAGLPPRAFLGDGTGGCDRGHDHAASFLPFLGMPVSFKPFGARSA